VRAILEPNTDSMATAEEAECAYTYEPLEEPDKSIRLLKILSVTPRITCTFKVAHLKDSPVFSCLSYVWGDATITEPVTVESKTLQITVNLAGAIRDVHRQWSAGELLAPGEEQWLWADALCINQKHDQEKNHQVPLMEQIYSSAHRVFAWLGDGGIERASKAVDANNIILHAIRQLPGYGFIQGRVQDDRQSCSKQEVLAEVGGEIFGAITDLTWLTEHYTTQSVPGESVHIISDAVKLFDLTYWTRLWIVQELVLARDVVLLCGPKKISWLEVCCVQFWIKLVGMKYSYADMPHSVPSLDWFNLMQIELPAEYTRVCGFKSWAHCRDSIQRRQLIPPADSPNEATLKARFDEAKGQFIMTEHALKFRATDAKDYVYALGGVTGLLIHTDYNSETTIAQVYQEYVVRWMNALAWGEVSEGDPVHPAMCDLWFLTYAGIGFLWTPIPGLLSWVPNLKGVAESIYNSGDERSTPSFDRNLGIFNDSGVFPQGTKRVTCLDCCLCCSAVVIEESLSIGPTVQSRGGSDYSFEEDKWLLWIYDLITGQKDMLVPIVEALCSLDRGLETLAKRDAALLLIADLEYVYKKRRAISSIDFYTALEGLAYPELITDNSCTPTSRREINPRRMQLDPVGKNEDRTNADRMVSVSIICYQQTLTNLHNFRLASTSSGLFALLPPLTEDGDMIWVLKGYTLSVVLRKHGDGYQFVGACSMPGLKKNDVASMIRDGRAPVKDIKIY
jgi:hypothetical protein